VARATKARNAAGHGRAVVAGPVERPAQDYDFRRPDRFDQSAVRSLEAAHEIFTRRVSSAWGAVLRGVVTVELEAVDQVTYDDYIRSLPSPDLMAVLSLAPLPGPIILDCSIELALQLLDRLLGASGGTGAILATRRPTDLESAVLADLVRRVVPAIEETLAPFEAVEGEVIGLEYNPQLVQAAAPGDSVLLLSFAVRATQGFEAEGLLTLCYPAPVATALVDRITSLLHAANPEDTIDEAWLAALRAGLQEVPVDLRIALADTPVPAGDLARLRVGDVLRLDHRVDRPVRGIVEDQEVLSAHLGRRGRRLGVQVITPPAAGAAHLTAAAPADWSTA
jgi:flagellar motor switch protein FliM